MEAWFQDEQTTLFQGDSLEVLRLLPDCSVQCVVTSPPYWALRDYEVEGQLGLEPTPEQYIANMADVFREVRRVLRDDGTLWLNCGDSYFNETSKSTTSLSREQAAWIASLIDGEGCIQIHRQKRESVADSFQLDISVGMMDKEMCVHAHQITGLGSYSVQARGVHDWSVRGQQAAKLLNFMIDLYRAGFEYGYNGDTRILEEIPESLSAQEIAEFDRGLVDGTRKANNMAILFVCALALAVVGLFAWMCK